MRILFVHEVNYLEKPIFEMHEIPEHLAARGHEVHFIYFQEGARGTIRRSSRKYPGRLNFGGEVQIATFPAIWTEGVSARILYALLSWPWILLELIKSRPDVVVNYSVPTSGWQFTFLARLLRIPIIYRAIDVSHRIRPTSFSGLIRAAEAYVIRNSNWISCNNGQMLNYVRTMGARIQASSVERPPLDLESFSQEFTPEELEKLRGEIGIPSGKQVVTYMGSFFYFSGLPQVLESIGRDDQAILLLIGSGEQDKELRDLVGRLGLGSRVIFTGPIPYSDLPRYFAISDVAINPMESALVSQTALPNKVLQYMAANLPVVSTDLPGLRAELSVSDSLRLVAAPSQVWHEAIKLIEDVSKGEIQVANSQAVGKLFDLERNIDYIEKRISSLVRVG